MDKSNKFDGKYQPKKIGGYNTVVAVRRHGSVLVKYAEGVQMPLPVSYFLERFEKIDTPDTKS